MGSNETISAGSMKKNSWQCIAPTGAKQTRFGEVPQFPEGLYDLHNNIYAWMVPNGSWGESNSGLIIGDSEALLVDTLWDVQYTQVMLQAMKALLEKSPLKYVINTHADGDHFWGNELVNQAQIITSEAAYEEMLSTQPKSLLLLGKVGRFLSTIRILGADQVGHWFQNMVAPYNFQEITHTPAQQKFSGQLTLSVGGRSVQLIEVGPAHTLGDLLVYVPDSRVIFTGDIVFNASTPVMWAGPIKNYIAALDRILALDIDIIIPGHGAITDKTCTENVKTYWQYMETQIHQHYQAGLSAQAAARAIALSSDFSQQPFANWNSPERIMVSTHTEYRHLQQRTDHPKVPELLNTMRKQALLAHELPNAKPAIMRKR